MTTPCPSDEASSDDCCSSESSEHPSRESDESEDLDSSDCSSSSSSDNAAGCVVALAADLQELWLAAQFFYEVEKPLKLCRVRLAAHAGSLHAGTTLADLPTEIFEIIFQAVKDSWYTRYKNDHYAFEACECSEETLARYASSYRPYAPQDIWTIPELCRAYEDWLHARGDLDVSLAQATTSQQSDPDQLAADSSAPESGSPVDFSSSQGSSQGSSGSSALKALFLEECSDTDEIYAILQKHEYERLFPRDECSRCAGQNESAMQELRTFPDHDVCIRALFSYYNVALVDTCDEHGTAAHGFEGAEDVYFAPINALNNQWARTTPEEREQMDIRDLRVPADLKALKESLEGRGIKEIYFQRFYGCWHNDEEHAYWVAVD